MVKIGNIGLGDGKPVVIQSMTNTDTNDVSATVAQSKRMIEAGCQLVRITVPTMKEVPAIAAIKEQLRAEGYETPLVADVHYNPEVADACAAIVEKVRINPGNYVDKRNFQKLDLTEDEYRASLQAMADRAKPLIEICKQHGTALRIGVNHGSLCDRIVSRYGNTPKAMAMSAMEWIDICQQFDFHNVVFSIKSSNVVSMTEATMLLWEMMHKNGTVYPLHIGVTEAGAGDEGRIKSAAGIGTLLLNGIGDTIRVSLTEPPENEVVFAKIMVDVLQNQPVSLHLLRNGNELTICCDEPDRTRWMALAAAHAANAHHQQKIKKLSLENQHFTIKENQDLADKILQACRIKMSQTEFISCPSCGRTQYDIQTALAKVKARFSGHPDLKIGVMGCVVNGPGEMADADFGIVGAGNGKVIVFKQKERLSAPLPIDQALDELERLLANRK